MYRIVERNGTYHIQYRILWIFWCTVCEYEEIPAKYRTLYDAEKEIEKMKTKWKVVKIVK